MTFVHPARPRAGSRLAALVGLIVTIGLAACEHKPSKEEIEAAKNTFVCHLAGERTVIKFEPGEARLLMPGGDRVTLYQIAAASGVRFTNGMLELRGKGMELQLIQNGVVTPFTSCEPYEIPKPPA
jgi:membrane-bound inhibitor of C-type lysozyme